MDQISYSNVPWQDGVAGLAGQANLVICDPIYDDPDLGYVDAAAELLCPGGSMYVFSDASGVAQTKLALDAQPELRFQNWLIWGPNDWGGRSSTRFGQKHDDLLFYTHRGAPHTFNADAVAVPKKMIGAAFNPSGRQTKIPNSVWDDLAGFSTMSSERVRIDGRCAPYQKPERVIERIVRASSNPGDLVVDLFAGVGTVPVVCACLGRRCQAFELNPTIHNAGLPRVNRALEDASGQFEAKEPVR